jgi:Flp pilus assembly protein TadG
MISCARSSHRLSVVSPARSAEDNGSAVVEFVLVSIIVVVLLLAVMQLAMALHIRNTLISAAGEGARFAAAADRTPSGGAVHAEQLIRASLPDSYAENVTARYATVDGVQTIEVEVVADLPLFGWVGADDTLHITGHAMEES